MNERKLRRATRRVLRASGVAADYGTLKGWFRQLRCRLFGHDAAWQLEDFDAEEYAGDVRWKCTRCPLGGYLGSVEGPDPYGGYVGRVDV